MRHLLHKHLIAGLVAALILTLAGCGRAADPFASSSSVSDRAGRESAAKVAKLEARERQVDETVWAKEMLAQKCGRVFEDFWDSLNAATNKLELAAQFHAGELALGNWDTLRHLPHGIDSHSSSGTGRLLHAPDWQQLLHAQQQNGWQLVQTEFRHIQFDTDVAGRPDQSRFYLAAHLTNRFRAESAALDGDLVVHWAAKDPGLPIVDGIDASRLTLKTRHGEAPFQPILTERIAAPEKASWIDPVILYDLDGDGASEIIVLASNLVYRRQPDGGYRSATFLRYPPALVFAGVMADFDGDGSADTLCATAKGLLLFQGTAAGAFDTPGQVVWEPALPLINPMVLTCGDIDRDGDPDVFLGQYRVPTLGQILKPAYSDANDSHQSHLLLNNGHGRWADATVAAGLEKKRWRRVFSASFVDLNEDQALDLVVVSDFAGVDLYRNDGNGKFTDVTDQWVPDSHAFGMGHAFADFNADGRLDFLMIGMNSSTVDRLQHLGLTRPGGSEDPSMRGRMTFGNRLYLANAELPFTQSALSDSVARSGWSWGCSAADFDNDGFVDLSIANGHDTQRSVRDYEAEFWLHDIYIEASADVVAVSDYFRNKYARTRGSGWSYGGYEKNRLYLNQNGQSFLEAGHLMGVALELDSRCVIADDLDSDGRMDLIVTTSDRRNKEVHSLHVYRNALSDAGNWIGFRFREAPGQSLAGTSVMLQYGGRRIVRQLVTGDSFRSQHANSIHFGLGAQDRVDAAEIRWANGRRTHLDQPATRAYHLLHPPARE